MLFLFAYKQHIYFLLPILMVLCITYLSPCFPHYPPLGTFLYFLPHYQMPQFHFKKLLNHLPWPYTSSVKTALPIRSQILKFSALITTSCLFCLLLHHLSLTSTVPYLSVLWYTSLNSPIIDYVLRTWDVLNTVLCNHLFLITNYGDRHYYYVNSTD